MADGIKYVDMTLQRAVTMQDDPKALDMMRRLLDSVDQVRAEQERFRTWCDRADKLYYAEDFSKGGADLWSDDPNLGINGRSHVSVNSPPTYIDVPASLQAVEPIESMLATGTDTDAGARTAASSLERVYTAWKAAEGYDLKNHKAIVVKALYGRTASRVYWDKDEGRPCVEVIEQPRNLYMGWRSDSYDKLEWVAYVQRMEPNAVVGEFGVEVVAKSVDALGTTIVPFVQLSPELGAPSRSWLTFGPARVEVWDYWYRKPLWRNGKFIQMDTYNVVFAGNTIVRGPTKYPEYDGDLPYRALFNTFLPGVPNGRPELYDMEHLIREKMERITAASQMIASAVAGDYWQLTGPEAPNRVPAGVKPKRNEVVAPGAGNRIEVITPFIAQFQLEQYLGRIDREMAVISGLNDLLLGLAPAQVLSSSKAINALIANYEARLSMRRRLLYAWRKANWELALKVWQKKDKTVRQIVDAGGGVLDIQDPSLSPRDEMETMTRALNAVNGKLASQRTGMDWIGIDDPETEQEMIREERTDATMFPADVQVMAQLMAALQSLGIQPPPGAQAQAAGQLASGQNDLRTALGGATPQNSTSSQLPGDQGVLPPEAGTPPAGGGLPFAQAPAQPQQSPVLAQTMIREGKASSRILTQSQLGRR